MSVTGGRQRDRSRALGFLASPVYLSCLLLLIVNDRILKHSNPGWVTGKLSDVVGPVVLAGLLTALVTGWTSYRRAVGVSWAASAALMVAVKTVPEANRTVAQALSLVAGPSSIVGDPTDLVGLVGLLACLLPALRSRPIARGGRRFAACVAICLAVPATVGTASCSLFGQNLVVEGSAIHLDWDGEDAVSEDGGLTWTRRTDEDISRSMTARSGAEPSRSRGSHSLRRPLCLPLQSAVCVRSRDDRLEETTDAGGTWHVVPGLPKLVDDEDEGGNPLPNTCGEPVRGISEVAAVPTDDGPVFVVAMRRDGIARRDPAGTWRILAPPLPGPPGPEPGPEVRRTWLPRSVRLLALGLVVASAALASWLLIRQRRRPPAPAGPWAVVPPWAAAPPWPGTGEPDVWHTPPPEPPWPSHPPPRGGRHRR